MAASDGVAPLPVASAAVNPQLLTVAPFSPADMSPWIWLLLWSVVWAVLARYINAIYATAANAAWHVWRRVRRSPKGVSVLSGSSEHPWGSRLLLAYATLIPSKQAYWRRLLRSFIYYSGAVVVGFSYLLTSFHTPEDLYVAYTPGMGVAFSCAAAHFLFCCIEDWPCRAHMGRTRREQLVVFWGYIVHHLLTAAAFLTCALSHQMSSMCLMGLTFEGPVLFGCLREVVALFDEDFDLFSKVPPRLLTANWALAFLSLIPCRYVSIGFFIYSAAYWRPLTASLLTPGMQMAYWIFGGIFLFINMYFTWLLTFWYRQDARYLRKKRAKQREKAYQLADEEQRRAEQATGGGSVYRYTDEDTTVPHAFTSSATGGSSDPLLRPLSPLLHSGDSFVPSPQQQRPIAYATPQHQNGAQRMVAAGALPQQNGYHAVSIGAA